MKHLLALAALAIGLVAASAEPARYRLPPEPAAPLPPGADVELVEAHCAACHSLDYLTTQPRGKGAGFWRDAVDKMVKVYGAPIDPDTASRVATYLARTFG